MVVIQADMWKVGQMRPGDSLRFVETTSEEATAAFRGLLAKALRTESRLLDIGYLTFRRCHNVSTKWGTTGSSTIPLHISCYHPREQGSS